MAFLDQLSPADFGAAVAHFVSLDGSFDRDPEYGMLLSAWTQADPLVAMAYAKTVAKNNFKHHFVNNTVLTAWATKDPEAAIRWAMSESKGENPNPYLAGIIRGIAQTDLTRAGALLAGMPPSDERGKAMDFMIPNYLAQGPEATRNWIDSLTDESLRNDAMERAAKSLQYLHTADTAAWLIAHLGLAADRMLGEVFQLFVNKDSQAALTSFDSMPVGGNRTQALHGMVTYMALYNATAGISLMDRYPEDVTDEVTESFILSALDKDPALAATQVERIGGEAVRDRVSEHLLDHWLNTDPTAARTWMAKTEISAAVRERFDSRK
jgi:hypothetical protein